MKYIYILVFIILLLPLKLFSQKKIPTPEEYFGFKPGADSELFNYQAMIDYLQIAAESSPRTKMIEIGESPMGKKMYLFFLSSETNIKNLEQLKIINQKLAFENDLSKPDLEMIMDEGKVFILATLSMHSNEVAPSQSAPLIAYEVATTTNEDLLGWLEDVVYMIVPNHNPDGMDMIVDFYKSTKGSKYEGGYMPSVYHKYVGHDNNRDFVTLTQSDTRVVAEIYSKTWMPQVIVEKHQMGLYGPRYFVPPSHDPISENVDAQIWNWTWTFGSNIAKDMTAMGLEGVSQHYLFDNYWPGSTRTAIWKNTVGLLTEAASVQIAKPVYVEKNELFTEGKGLGEYEKSINMPLPWNGGWWRLSDIVNYELASTWSIIKTGSMYRKDILTMRNVMSQKQVQKGKTESPAYFIIPQKQHDPGELINLINLLDMHNITVFKTISRNEIDRKIVESGDYVIPLAQPFRTFIKEVMEVQKFPERHYTPEGELIKPYDITSWSLPLHNGIDVFNIEHPSQQLENKIEQVKFPIKLPISIRDDVKALVFPVSCNESFKMAFRLMGDGKKVYRINEDNAKGLDKGDFVVEVDKKKSQKLHTLLAESIISPVQLKEFPLGLVKQLEMPSIALIETNLRDRDAGWTRYLFDSYSIPFTLIKTCEVEQTDLTDFDIIVFPDNDKISLLEENRSWRTASFEPQYLEGVGKTGMQKLMKFVDDGGTILSWGQSPNLFMGSQSIKITDTVEEKFQIPVNDIASTLKAKGLYCPGSLVNINLKEGHPLNYGMPNTVGVFFRGYPVFSTSIPYFDLDRRVVASFPEESNILLSGYAENINLVNGKPAIVWIKKGQGQFVLYGFCPQFRASTAGTYKLLFNGLLLD